MIRIQLEPDDYLAASRLHGWWALSLAVFGAIFGVVGALRLLSSANDGGRLGVVMLWTGGLFLVAFLLSWFVLTPRRVRRIFRQQKALQRPIEMDWGGDTLNVKTDIGENDVPWSDMLKWRENKRMFLLYLSEAMFYIIPKRTFADNAAIDAFREKLREKISN